ncbi:hypothetical protein ACFYPK_19605 [Streptomyces halstedii]|uniref:hypothetical protein n=1 Tax=Streptomyces TaxID=1883 RepID=UPI0004A9A69E|nr:hypothetical protein [Streptomyces sp. NTK 937]KDQ71280.1 hypothetical protein DT87_30010 [Streptomyces sp. NTK 937]
MPDGTSWTRRYEALPAAVRSELESMWADPADEPEDLAIRYQDRLSKLGLWVCEPAAPGGGGRAVRSTR